MLCAAVATSLLTYVEIPYPTYFQIFINYFDFVNLDFIPWSSVQCVATLTFYDRLIIVALLPPVVVVLVALVPFMILSAANKSDFTDSDHTRDQRILSRQKIVKLLVFALFLMYPALSARVVSFFVCRNVNGEEYLVADFNLKCFDDLWFRYLGLGVVCLLLYRLGIPLVLFWMLYRNRFKLRDPTTIVSLGIMYESYDLRYWFFELVDMAEKLFLTSLLGFFSPSVQSPVGMAVICAYLSAQCILSPYVRRIDDRFCLLSQVHLFLILLVSYTLSQSEFVIGSLVDILASILMLGVLAALITVLVLHFIIFVRKLIRARQRNARLKEDAAADEPNDLVINPLSGAVAEAKAATSADRHKHSGRVKTVDRIPKEDAPGSPSLHSSRSGATETRDLAPLDPDELNNRNEHNTGRWANDENLAKRNIAIPMSFYMSAGNKRGSAIFIPPEVLAQALAVNPMVVADPADPDPPATEGTSIDMLRKAGQPEDSEVGGSVIGGSVVEGTSVAAASAGGTGSGGGDSAPASGNIELTEFSVPPPASVMASPTSRSLLSSAAGDRAGDSAFDESGGQNSVSRESVLGSSIYFGQSQSSSNVLAPVQSGPPPALPVIPTVEAAAAISPKSGSKPTVPPPPPPKPASPALKPAIPSRPPVPASPKAGPTNSPAAGSAAAPKPSLPQLPRIPSVRKPPPPPPPPTAGKPPVLRVESLPPPPPDPPAS